MPEFLLMALVIAIMLAGIVMTMGAVLYFVVALLRSHSTPIGREIRRHTGASETTP